MKQNEIRLLNLLRESAFSYYELADALKVSDELLNQYLIELYVNGYDIQRKYYADGNIMLVLPTKLSDDRDLLEEKAVPLITFSNQNEFKSLAISDLHFGCAKERLDLVYKAFDYAVKNDIHIIFSCGDMIDGDPNHSAGKPIITDVQDQIDYFIENYPRVRNILTFAVLGDHEQLASKLNMIDIRRAIINRRNDIIIGDHDEFNVMIKDEMIRLEHKANDKLKNAKINLFGHAHKIKATIDTNTTNAKERFLNIQVPALSNANQSGAAFLEMNLYFESRKIGNVELKEWGFDENNDITDRPIVESKIKIPVYSESDDQYNLFMQEDEPKVYRNRLCK